MVRAGIDLQMSLSGMAIKLIPSPSNKDYTHVYRVLAFVICYLAIGVLVLVLFLVNIVRTEIALRGPNMYMG